ncbi:MAG: cyclic nucleotide-binding domain-containing protein [Calditrichaceae bacterium]
MERLKFKTFSADETICKIGDPGDEMYIIISGEVKICIYGDKNQEQVVAKLTSGDYFGEMALLTGETRSASVIATEPSETFLLHKNDFDVILEKFPSISLSMGKIVSQRLRDTLKKATQITKADKIETSQEGPSGDLSDIPLVDLISFCESNSLSGTMKIDGKDGEGVFEFESGELKSVKLNDAKDDQALDQMLKWSEGKFHINIRPLTIKKDKKAAEIGSNVVKRILIANNSLVVRKVIERAFKGLGYEVSSAKNIEESLSSIKQSKPDIIISDIKLPDGNGIEFLKKARENGNISFIFLTDDSSKTDFGGKLGDLDNAEVTKSHEVSEIVKIVENMI